MEKEDKIIVKWAQEDVETSNNLLINNYYYFIYSIEFFTIFAKYFWLVAAN